MSNGLDLEVLYNMAAGNIELPAVQVVTPPALVITGASLAANQTTVTLNGTINAADASGIISIYDGTTLLGTTTAGANDKWTANVTVSAQGVHTLTAQATYNGGDGGGDGGDGGDGAGGDGGLGDAVTASTSSGTGISNSVIDLVNASTSLSGGGQIVLFSGSGDSVSFSNTAGILDSVSGSNGSVYLTGAQATVSGGGNIITFEGGSGNAVSISNTANVWDFVSGSKGTVTLTGAQTAVSGGGNTIIFAGTVTGGMAVTAGMAVTVAMAAMAGACPRRSRVAPAIR